MHRKITFILSLLAIIAVIIYFYQRISAYDMRFYTGKDDGAFIILQSICILSAVFYFIMAKTKRWLYLFIGFFAGIVSSIIGYFLAVFISSSTGQLVLLFHILGCATFILSFFMIEKQYSRS